MIGGEGLTRLAFRGHESIPKRQATPPAAPTWEEQLDETPWNL